MENGGGRDLEEKETFLLLSQGTQFMTKSGFEIMKCFHFFFSLSGSRARVCELQRGELYNNNPQSP